MCGSHKSVAELLGRSSHCLDKTQLSNCRLPVDGSGGTPHPVLLTGAKKSHLGCRISFEIRMGFQNFVVINKIHPFIYKKSAWVTAWCHQRISTGIEERKRAVNLHSIEFFLSLFSPISLWEGMFFGVQLRLNYTRFEIVCAKKHFTRKYFLMRCFNRWLIITLLGFGIYCPGSVDFFFINFFNWSWSILFFALWISF